MRPDIVGIRASSSPADRGRGARVAELNTGSNVPPTVTVSCTGIALDGEVHVGSGAEVDRDVRLRLRRERGAGAAVKSP